MNTRFRQTGVGLWLWLLFVPAAFVACGDSQAIPMVSSDVSATGRDAYRERDVGSAPVDTTGSRDAGLADHGSPGDAVVTTADSGSSPADGQGDTDQLGSDDIVGTTSTPRISPEEGELAYGTEITIEGPEGATVYFTLDGSAPSVESKRYRDPLRMSPAIAPAGECTVRAVAVAPGRAPSEEAVAHLTRQPGVIVHARKPEGWSTLYAHYWATEPGGDETTWPGVEMEPEGGGWYRLAFPGQTTVNLVLSDNGSPQTADLRLAQQEGWYLDGEWWDVDPARYARFTFPDGRLKAVVFSMDDGNLPDRRLVAMLDEYDLRGTFHLNSGLLGDGSHVGADEVASLYAGHEVSAHTVDHPSLTGISLDAARAELADDQAALSALTGTPVRGLAYPFGDYDQAILDLLPELGIVYARVVPTTGGFGLPGARLEWRGTCHQVDADDAVDRLLALDTDEMALLFIWGHSWQFDNGEPSWETWRSVCERLSGRADIWNATAIEMADYLDAIRALTPSLATDTAANDSSLSLWLKTGDGVRELLPGQSTAW